MKKESSKELVKAYLKRADKALVSAKILFKNDEMEDSASRAYYAMFYAAQAILASKGLNARSHKGARILFGRHIIREGLMGKDYAKMLDKAFDLRQRSDYEALKKVTRDSVKDAIKSAEEFIKTVKQLSAFAD